MAGPDLGRTGVPAPFGGGRRAPIPPRSGRFVPRALMIALAGLAQAGGAPAARADGGAGSETAYQGCRDGAGGDWSARVACADAAIAAASKEVENGAGPGARNGNAAFDALLVAGGDALLSLDGSLAARVAVADAAARFALARAALVRGAGDAPPAPAPSDPLTVLGGGADLSSLEAPLAASRASTCARSPAPDCPARFDALLAAYLLLATE